MSEQTNDDIVVRRSPYALGIDLGTTNTSASLYIKGEAKTITLENKLSIPSAVRFEDRKADGVVVGNKAKKYQIIKPDEVFVSIKTMMRDDGWRNDSDVASKFQIEGAEDLTPTDVAAEILKKVMEEVHVQQEVDTLGTIEKIVISVPANTTNEYRENVYKAALKAGLGWKENDEVKVDENGHPYGVIITEEPKAAAYMYAVEQNFLSQEKEQIIMVYDFGGGTFDVTILHMDSSEGAPKFTVKSTHGIGKLGGDDIDKAIMDLVAGQFKAESEIDVFDLVSDQNATSKKALREAQQKIKNACEKAKIEISGGSSSTEIHLVGFLKDGNGILYNLEYELQAEELTQHIRPLLEQTIACANDALSEAKLTIDEVNRIVLVGGSSKAPWVRDIIEEKLGKTPYMSKNVDVVVSRGNAFLGSFVPIPTGGKGDEVIYCPQCNNVVKSTPSEENPCEHCGFVMGDTTDYMNKNIGVELQGAVFGLVLPKGEMSSDDDNDVLISGKQTYYVPENSNTVQITVYETIKTIETEEIDEVVRPVANHYISEKNDQDDRVFDCIGGFVVKDVKPGEPVEITMKIDKNTKILQVTAATPSATGSTELNIEKR